MEVLKLTSDLPKETLINMDIVIWFLGFEKNKTKQKSCHSIKPPRNSGFGIVIYQ